MYVVRLKECQMAGGLPKYQNHSTGHVIDRPLWLTFHLDILFSNFVGVFSSTYVVEDNLIFGPQYVARFNATRRI